MYKYNNMLAISVGIKAKCPLRKNHAIKKGWLQRCIP